MAVRVSVSICVGMVVRIGQHELAGRSSHRRRASERAIGDRGLAGSPESRLAREPCGDDIARGAPALHEQHDTHAEDQQSRNQREHRKQALGQDVARGHQGCKAQREHAEGVRNRDGRTQE